MTHPIVEFLDSLSKPPKVPPTWWDCNGVMVIFLLVLSAIVGLIFGAGFLIARLTA